MFQLGILFTELPFFTLALLTFNTEVLISISPSGIPVISEYIIKILYNKYI